MKHLNKIISTLICISMLLIFASPVSALDENPAESVVSSVEEKIYCNATIDQEFAGGTVLVVLDRNVGAINKVHDKTFFWWS